MSCSCHICAQVAGIDRLDLLRDYLPGPRARRILRETRHAVAMPSIGALAPGHVLVCPRAHHRSWAAASHAELLDGLELIAGLAAELEQRTGRPVHLFEHGNGPEAERIACSVEHAHWHLLPHAGAIDVAAATSERWEPIAFTAEALREQLGATEYVLHVAAGGVARVHLAGRLPSQTLRRVFAEALRIGDAWNWREHPRPATVRATSALFEPPAERLSA